jgi:hypothetical protein
MAGGNGAVNVKITENSVTFKITVSERDILAKGQKIEKSVPICGNDFVMIIDPAPEEAFQSSKEEPLRLILDKDESCLMLCTTKQQIKSLVDLGRDKDGICANIDGLDVVLQVDIRPEKSRLKKG